MFGDMGKIARNISLITFYTDRDGIWYYLKKMPQMQSRHLWMLYKQSFFSFCLFDLSVLSIFFCLAVTGTVAMMTASSLSSVASYELLGPQKEIYGRQRLFGTISWGIVCP